MALVGRIGTILTGSPSPTNVRARTNPNSASIWTDRSTSSAHAGTVRARPPATADHANPTSGPQPHCESVRRDGNAAGFGVITKSWNTRRRKTSDHGEEDPMPSGRASPRDTTPTRTNNLRGRARGGILRHTHRHPAGNDHELCLTGPWRTREHRLAVANPDHTTTNGSSWALTTRPVTTHPETVAFAPHAHRRHPGPGRDHIPRTHHPHTLGLTRLAPVPDDLSRSWSRRHTQPCPPADSPDPPATEQATAAHGIPIPTAQNLTALHNTRESPRNRGNLSSHTRPSPPHTPLPASRNPSSQPYAPKTSRYICETPAQKSHTTHNNRPLTALRAALDPGFPSPRDFSACGITVAAAASNTRTDMHTIAMNTASVRRSPPWECSRQRRQRPHHTAQTVGIDPISARIPITNPTIRHSHRARPKWRPKNTTRMVCLV
ncbi:hypothetical protein EHYA_07355 [Embleya hyalina]|uniref:Uncharacterized protein n=1 Tax=Embleya hyalina TaxID=516124 RepID=A0A401YYH5_9ACTN|nr:hypothetical protein EHYA_07355 [Embleya hyalina]